MAHVVAIYRAHRLAFCVTLVLLCLFNSSSQAQSTLDTGNKEISFDLPSQSLKQALANFDQRTNLSVFFSSDLVDGKFSSPVRGTYLPEKALEILLEETGLVVKSVAPGAFVLIAKETGALTLAPNSVSTDNRLYSGLLQAQVLKVLCNRKELELGRYRLALSIYLDVNGKVSDAELLDSTGNSERDKRILKEIERIDIGHAPPVQQKPFVILIRPRNSVSPPACPVT